MKDLLTWQDFTCEEIKEMLELSLNIKKEPTKYKDALQGKSIALLFQKSSTRTRCSAEIAMQKLGGYAMYLDWQNTNFVLTDSADEAKVLSSYVDIILARMLKHSDLKNLTQGSNVPVINGLCNKFHPLQALADMMTIKETIGHLKGLGLTYLGIANNVSNSLVAIGMKLGVKTTVAVHSIDSSSIDNKLYATAQSSDLFEITENVKQAIKDADIIYTDTWINIEHFDKTETLKMKKKITELHPYQINKGLLAKAPPHAKIMHCLPAHEGLEVEKDIIHHTQSIVFQQAANRLWSAMGVLVWMLS